MIPDHGPDGPDDDRQVEPGDEHPDPPLPRAWVLACLVTALLAAGSWLWNHGLQIGATPLERYLADRAAALDTGDEVTEPMLAELARDKLAVQAGQAAFARNCSKCHGARGEGQIGPNLTDRFWIGGGAPLDIYRAILHGRDGKGMPSWGLPLGTGACKQITAYLLTLRNTDVPGRPPQGTRSE